MRRFTTWMIVITLVAVVGRSGSAVAGPSFGTDSVRGRYTGHLVVGANFSDGTNPMRLEAQLLAAFIFDGKSELSGSSSISVTIPGQTPFTCPFTATGTYQLGDDGLGTGTVTLVPSAATCGDGGGVTLQLGLLVGGHNRRRLDVSVNGATGIPDGEPLPLIGTGTLEK